MEAGFPALPAAPRHRPLSPWAFLLVSLPVGIFNGATGTLLSYLLRREGNAVGSIANEMAVLGLPPILYFLWSPLSDFWIRRRSWLVFGSGVTALLTIVAFQLRTLAGPAAEILLFLATCAVMLVSASIGGLMAAQVPDGKKVRFASIWQTGNLGGNALGAGALIMLSAHISRPLVGLAAAAVVFLPSLAALTIDEPPVRHVPGETMAERLRVMGSEFKVTFFTWSALLSLLMLTSPMGSGGAVALLGGIAVDYGVSGNQVAWLNGIAGAVLTAAGAFLAGLIPGQADARRSYALLGLANALSIGILCIGPARPLTYLAGTVLYLLTVGGCYTVFTALVLQVLGPAGSSGGTRYAIAVSLGNAPIAYMAWIDGRGASWFGTRGLAGADMVVSGATAIGFLLWLAARRRSRRVAGSNLPELAESPVEEGS